MKIVLVTDIIHAGGAETFVLRLAEQLGRQKQDVYLFVLQKKRIDTELQKLLASSINVYSANIPFVWVWQKIDSLLFRLRWDFSFLRWFYTQALKKVLKNKKIQLIHSHLFTADIIAVAAGRRLNIPVVTTMHGDYLQYSTDRRALKISYITKYEKTMRNVLSSLKAVVCISEEQKEQMLFLKHNYQASFDIYKIYNGYSVPPVKKKISKEQLEIPNEAFVIGMVARGIREKGWAELIEAFLKIDIPGTYLLLVGDGEFLQGLRRGYVNNTRIKFIGNVNNPIDYIELFDIACLPSYFKSESLPTVIIEYLFCRKPVIATRKGEIPSMLHENTTLQCGLLIDIDSSKNMINSLANAILTLYRDKQLYFKYSSNTENVIKFFDLESCAREYEYVYEKAVS